MKFQNVKAISEIREEEMMSPEARIAQLEAENTELLSTIEKLQGDRKTLMLAVTELYELILQQSGGTQ